MTVLSDIAPHRRGRPCPMSVAIGGMLAEEPRDIALTPPEAMAAAVARITQTLQGIEAYQRSPHRRSGLDAPVLAQLGSARLLDYRAPDAPKGPALLIVPSLINDASILDLRPEISFMRALASAGIAPFLLDWDAPGLQERRFDAADYSLHRVLPALDAIHAATGSTAALGGYCMGGLLALGALSARPDAAQALITLGTPWNFQHFPETGVIAPRRADVAAMIDATEFALGAAPSEAVRYFFALRDPFQAARKFRRFAQMNPQSAAAAEFVALEDWLECGPPLAAPAARECLDSWICENAPMRGAWRINGAPVDPAQIRRPSLVIAATRDHVAPPDCAKPLAAALPAAQLLEPVAGHVGMIIGRAARETVIPRIAAFLR